MPAFVEEYFSGKNSGKFDGLLQQYTSQLDNSELHLRGFALALGSLPQKLLQGKVEKIYKDNLDSISSPSSTVKIQIIGGKVYLR